MRIEVTKKFDAGPPQRVDREFYRYGISIYMEFLSKTVYVEFFQRKYGKLIQDVYVLIHLNMLF